MSAPTQYTIKDHVGKPLALMYTSVWSWFPLNRVFDRKMFDIEVGELIVTDLAVYCAGKQPGKNQPKFTLADVGSIESEGGCVMADEFASCVSAYIERSKDVSEALDAAQTVKKQLEVIIDARTKNSALPSPHPAP